MAERVVLLRPLSGRVIHADVPYVNGTDTSHLNGPADVSLTLPPEWWEMDAADGLPMLAQRRTLVVVERENRTIRNVGLIDHPPQFTGENVEVTAGGVSMLPGQSGPWEGDQGWFTVKDPLELYYDIWAQTQSYPTANVGVQLVGDRRSGSTVGSPSSVRWLETEREHQKLKREVDRWEARVLEHERVLTKRQERMFRAVGLRRIGSVNVSGNKPDNPGVKADSTIWVNENNDTAYRWRTDHNDWIAYSSANEETRAWLNYRRNLEVAKDRLSDAQYALEPVADRLEELEDEARGEYTLHFWQNHDMQVVIEELMELGPFEFRETATWQGERLVPQIETGSPKVGVRRKNIHLEIGVNVLEYPTVEGGEVFTGVTVFGAGEGSETLSSQRQWEVPEAVRNIYVDVDKDAHSKTLVRAASRKAEREAKKENGEGFTRLVVHHGKACPEGSFLVGDEIPVTGVIPGKRREAEWVRVLSITHQMGSKTTTVEVEAI